MATQGNGHDDYDINAADDQRRISGGAMLLAAVIFALLLMAVVYGPKMWGLDRFGADLLR